MKKSHLFSALIMLLFTSGLQAQKDYLPGTITFNSGDSLSGYINYDNWSRTPTSIEFRRSPDARTEVYTLSVLKGFEVKGADKFHKGVIWKETEPATPTAQRYESGPLRPDTVFLRSVVEATKLSLYEYAGDKTHYYIKPEGDTLQELLNPSHYNASTGHYQTRAVYRDQLKKYALGHARQKQLFRKIDELPYREAHLEAIVLELNGLEKASYVNSEKGITSRQAFVAAGVTFSVTFPDADRRSLVTSYKKTSLQVSGGMDFFTLKNFQHVFFRTELRLGNSSYQNERRETNYRGELMVHQYNADYLYINPAVHVLFPFLNTDNARLYGGAGISYTFLKSLQYEHTVHNYATGTKESAPRDLYAQGRGWGGAHLSLGWMYKKRIELRVFRNLGGLLVPETTSKYNGVLVGFRF